MGAPLTRDRCDWCCWARRMAVLLVFSGVPAVVDCAVVNAQAFTSRYAERATNPYSLAFIRAAGFNQKLMLIERADFKSDVPRAYLQFLVAVSEGWVEAEPELRAAAFDRLVEQVLAMAPSRNFRRAAVAHFALMLLDVDTVLTDAQWRQITRFPELAPLS